MQKMIFMDKYPIYETTLSKKSAAYDNVQEVIAYLKAKIDSDSVATYIAQFDPYTHTASLGGEIHPDIVEAKEIIFCFGQKLLNSTVVAVRPRAIGVIDTGENLVINFMEAPNEPSTNTMIEWVNELKNSVL
ncbi:MAG: hypothetical protein JXQ76_03335 [Campylobacterales bacterium]|nr:hypothetical protein [Campylobacterales bacterium]